MSGKPKPKKLTTEQQHKEVDFLHEGFDMPTPNAAGLVTSDERDAERLSRAANKRQLHKDELKDAPTPKAPRKDLVPDADEEKLKPLIRNRKT